MTVAAIARHAGVSRKFIYAHPELLAQIEQRARQNTERASARAVAEGQVTVASLRADLANAKAHNYRLRQQLRALEQRLSEALGRDIADELEPAGERPNDLRRRLRDAQAQIFELTESLTDAREELDASARSTASCSPIATGRSTDHPATPPKLSRSGVG